MITSWDMAVAGFPRGGPHYPGDSTEAKRVIQHGWNFSCLHPNHDDYETGNHKFTQPKGEVSLWHSTLAFTILFKGTVCCDPWKDVKPSRRLYLFIVMFKDLGNRCKHLWISGRRGRSCTGAYSLSLNTSGKLVLLRLTTFSKIPICTFP